MKCTIYQEIKGHRKYRTHRTARIEKGFIKGKKVLKSKEYTF